MKRILTFACTASILICACSCSKKNKDKITILTPNDAPYISTLNLGSRYDIEKGATSANLPASFAEGTKDLIIAPINLGSKLYKASKSSYKLLGVVTWGNLYIASQKPFESLSDIDSIEGFGKNSVNEYILSYTVDKPIEYKYTTTNEAGEAILSSNKYVAVAEPTLSKLKAKTTIYSISVSDLYKNKTGKDSYPQAAVFVRGDISSERMDDIKSDFVKSTSSIDMMANKAMKMSLFDEKDIALSAITNSNISFKYARDVKEDIDQFVSINPSFFGGALNDEFYA